MDAVMKKTLNVNIGSVAFVIDEDAYYMLKNYLDDVGGRFEPTEAADVLGEVEARIADIFCSNLASPRQVVDVGMVRQAISVLGSAEAFGERRASYSRPRESFGRLRRSRNDRVIGGVCGGLAEYFGVDVAVVRILTFLLIFFGGISVWLYIILWIVIPADR